MTRTLELRVAMLLGLMLLAAAGCTDVPSGTAPDAASSRPADGTTAVRVTPCPSRSVQAATSAPAARSGPTLGSAVVILDTADAQPARVGCEYDDLPDAPTAGPYGQISVRDLTDDGAAVVVTGRSPTTDDWTLRMYQSTVGLQRGSTFTAFPQPVAGPARNAVYLDAAGRYTAWTETSSTSLDEFDWKVFLHDADTGSTRLLGDSVDIAPVRPVSALGETDPTVGERDVFWAATAPRSPAEGFDDLIMGAPLDGSAGMRRVVVGGYYPAADGDDLFYVSSTHLDRNEAYAGRPVTRGTGRCEIRRLRDGRTSVVASGPLTGEQSISGLTAHHGSVAFTLSRTTATTSTLVLLEPGGNRTEIRMQHDGGAPSVRLTDRFLAWGSGSGNGDAGQYALDRPSGRLLKLGELSGRSNIYASPSGDFLGWSVPPPPTARPTPGQPFPVHLVRWMGPASPIPR